MLSLANEVSAAAIGFSEPVEWDFLSDSQVIGTCWSVNRLSSCPVGVGDSVAGRAPHPLALDCDVVSRSPETR
jgi:hypothetical protein